MNATHLIFLLIFLLISLADLRYRVVPGVEIVFCGAILVTWPSNPLAVGVIVLAVAWGWLQTCPYALALPLLFYPGAWPVLLTSSGVRQGFVGRGDLLAAGSLALVFPWSASILALIGLEIWRRWFVKRNSSSIPALPGMTIGLASFLILKTLNLA